MAEMIMFSFTFILRLLWVLTVGVFVMFPLGTLIFIITDLFFPKSDKSYGALVTMYKWGSCHWFKGIRLSMQTDDYEVQVKIKEIESVDKKEPQRKEKIQEEKDLNIDQKNKADQYSDVTQIRPRVNIINR